MTASILTLNAGSSSIKFGLYDRCPGADPRVRLTGQVEAIGVAPRLKVTGGETRDLPEIDGHDGALKAILGVVEAAEGAGPVAMIGHRIVHGGPDYAEPALLTDAAMAYLETLSPFAPLHQPHNLAGVRAAQAAFPGVPNIACFDTAFHRNHPWVNDTFALPRAWYDKGVRRYGFHGLSYEFIIRELDRIAPEEAAGRVVVAHLGNGASMCAVRGGQSIASTLGFTAVDGLPMGTRCGQLDPGVVLYLIEQEGMTTAEVTDLLYKKSGLLGLSGVSSDMRTLEASDAPDAAQAIDYFVFRIRRELGALAAVLGGLDTLVFTGGIGEHSATIRARVCEGMEWLGMELAPGANARHAGLISKPRSQVHIRRIETDEELTIARAAEAALAAG
jgi:acetate kinase